MSANLENRALILKSYDAIKKNVYNLSRAFLRNAFFHQKFILNRVPLGHFDEVYQLLNYESYRLK